MTESLTPCPLCHGGSKRPGTTTFTVDLGFGVVVVRQVPALVCDLCGTDWVEDDTAAALEEIVAQARLKHPELEVVRWGDQDRTVANQEA
jgi:YgiT-type zinc finger domain-containing protein